MNAIAFTASTNLEEARDAEKRLKARYGHVPPEEADVIVALGGDGFMLRSLHRFMDHPAPIFGMNRGSVGFLMNAYSEDGLTERLANAKPIDLHPIKMKTRDIDGAEREVLAINEVSLLRQTRLAAKIRIQVDGIVRMEELICDGVMVATPAGSTAYNLSVHGPILPLGAGLLALTPISAFRPRQWRGALLPESATVTFHVLDAAERPVSAVADYTEVRQVVRVSVNVESGLSPRLLFDPEHNLEERIIKEQFLP
ncbi:MAG: NAD kinase [Proteobacteria bacterium]|nr:NAD kinase [Pseudomonadota bacterium]